MSNPSETPDDVPAQPEMAEVDGVQRQAGLVSVEATAWEGPFPAPDDLRQYEAILPGMTNRLLILVENEQAHSHSQERVALEQRGTALETARMVVVADSRRSYIGIIFGFVISLLGIGGSIYLIATGHDWAGATLGGINLTGLVGVFVYGARRAGRRRNAEPEVETPEPSR